ncbi:MAG: amidohydrolase [Nitrospirae bacterium]|nr:MAG: amidohydrolase [Nitrospirota bacterium]
MDKREKIEVDLIVEGDYLLTMSEGEELIRGGAVVVTGDRITDIGTIEDMHNRYHAKKRVGGSDMAVLPGFVNTHTHAAMVYFRGIADDLPLQTWLEEHIWPAEAKFLSEEFVRDATELACLEMLRSGVTLYNDMYFFEDASAEAVKKAGIRAVLGAGILDFPTAFGTDADDYLRKAEEFINRWKGDDLVTPCVAPHAPYTCSPETYKKAVALAGRYGLTVHTHLSETRWEVEEIKNRYGKTPIEHLDSHGLLAENTLAAHVVWPTDKEIEILAKRGVSVSHCIESNLKLASGIAPVPGMLKGGVRVTFGTDGAASNNNLDIIEEMSTAAKVHKASTGDPTVLDAKTVLYMATRWGAEALGFGDSLGSLEKGKLADMVLIDLRKPHLSPLYNIYSQIVYAATGKDVDTVIVNGEVVLNGRHHHRISEEEVLERAKGWKGRIISN